MFSLDQIADLHVLDDNEQQEQVVSAGLQPLLLLEADRNPYPCCLFFPIFLPSYLLLFHFLLLKQGLLVSLKWSFLVYTLHPLNPYYNHSKYKLLLERQFHKAVLFSIFPADVV